MAEAIQSAIQTIRAYIAASSTPEDPAHADNTLEWLLRLHPQADEALQLAALGHDIDRASPNKVRRDDFGDYDAFKAAHARHSAEILRQLLTHHHLPTELIERTCELVSLHEQGGTPDADILKDADSLSFFDTNLPLYLQREGTAETVRRAIWGLKRLSPATLEHLQKKRFQHPDTAQILTQALQQLHHAS